MTIRPPSQVSVNRFKAEAEALIGQAPGRLGIAVSGGPDSLALLLLAVAAFPERMEAATVDHGLRAGSAAEALHVEALCERIGCPHAILNVTVAKGSAGLQAQAREARYQALAGWAARRGLRYLATAHHADDQAETFLMRLQRGSGVAGLAGIRPARRLGDITIIRPLLGWTKAELVHIVSLAGIEAADDPSNRDPRFDRTAARRLLAENPGLDPIAIAHSALALQEAEEALRWAANRLWDERIGRSNGRILFDRDQLPAELKRRLVARILYDFAAGPPPRGEEIGRLLNLLEQGKTGTLSGVKCSGGPVWTFESAPARRKTAK